MASARNTQSINLQPVEHGSLSKILPDDTSLAVLTFKDWTYYLLRNNIDVFKENSILHCCMFVFLCMDSTVLQ